MKKISGIVLLIALLLASCSKTKQSEVGKYVYVDCVNTIHVDRECVSKLVDNPKTKEECFANMQGVVFLDTCNITEGYHFCPRCIDDNAYQRLSTMIERNRIKPPAY